MIGLSLAGRAAEPIDVLCLGAHADDIEIGCGGTILSLQKVSPRPRFHWVVLSAEGQRRREAEKAAGLFTSGCETTVVLKEYRDGFLPYQGAEVNKQYS